jgi:phospholipid/cholesterol/gamma-HCH transport system permease protein
MTKPGLPGQAQLHDVNASPVLRVRGDWILGHYPRLRDALRALPSPLPASARVDMAELGEVDTAGAALLTRLLDDARLPLPDDLAAEKHALLSMVADAQPRAAPEDDGPKKSPWVTDVLAHIGWAVTIFLRDFSELLAFVGLTLEAMLRTVLSPRRWRFTSTVSHVEQTGLDAVPIVALLTFLVGAVVSFLGATVLKDFGASIYTVNLVAFSFLREFGVLLAAILIAGRTASAFAAQIGSMRANEEVDAIRALGLDPVELLVLPRVMALLVALPILTFIGMLSGIVGGMAVCALSLDISPAMFFDIFRRDIGVQHFLVGMAKAPVLAFLIAVIGCMEGFRVSGSAQSVGEHTTSAVVKSIFVVILLDALAALFYMEMGW